MIILILIIVLIIFVGTLYILSKICQRNKLNNIPRKEIKLGENRLTNNQIAVRDAIENGRVVVAKLVSDRRISSYQYSDGSSNNVNDDTYIGTYEYYFNNQWYQQEYRFNSLPPKTLNLYYTALNPNHLFLESPIKYKPPTVVVIVVIIIVTVAFTISFAPQIKELQHEIASAILNTMK